MLYCYARDDPEERKSYISFQGKNDYKKDDGASGTELDIMIIMMMTARRGKRQMGEVVTWKLA